MRRSAHKDSKSTNRTKFGWMALKLLLCKNLTKEEKNLGKKLISHVIYFKLYYIFDVIYYL